MDLQTLSIKVHSSRLLSESERAYWLKNLPHMSEGQLMKLSAILQQAEGLVWNASMQNYVTLATKTPAAAAA